MRRFFISSYALITNRGQLSVQMSGPEFHHLRHVLRLDVGAQIALYDERGTTYHGTLTHLAKDHAEVRLTDTVPPSAPTFRLTLAQSVLKGSKMDLVVEKATELGVHTIIPFFSDFTVARIPSAKQAERVARWRRLAQAAAKQSGSRLPEIASPLSFETLLHSSPSHALKVICSEREHNIHLKAFAEDFPTPDAVWIAVGPEGGFSSQEMEHARAAGYVPLSLGPSVLRAETASMSAVALCQFLWRDIQFPPLP